MSPGGEGKMSFLPRSLSWKTGRREAVRVCAGAGGGSPCQSPSGFGTPWPRPVPSRLFSRFDRNVLGSSGCRSSGSAHTWHCRGVS